MKAYIVPGFRKGYTVYTKTRAYLPQKQVYIYGHYGAYFSCELRMKTELQQHEVWWYKHFQSNEYVVIILPNHRNHRSRKEKTLRQAHSWDGGRNVDLGNTVKKHGRSGPVLSFHWVKFLSESWLIYFWWVWDPSALDCDVTGFAWDLVCA